MPDDIAGRSRKAGPAAYLSLVLAILFFSGVMASDQWWGVLDFTTLNGAWGVLAKAVLSDGADGIRTLPATLRGAGGSGAMDGFAFAFMIAPTVMFAIAMVTVFERYGALDAARVLLTPVLRPLLGIPGAAALALISSLQSTDGGAALTRRLRDEGALTDREAYVFAAFQMASNAPIGNFLTSGTVLYLLKDQAGHPAVPVSLGFALALALGFKVVSAQLMRLALLGMKEQGAGALRPVENPADGQAGGQERGSPLPVVFAQGAVRGWQIVVRSLLPNVLMAFVIIKALTATGLLAMIGQACGPAMAVFGLPGEAAAVLLSAWVSAGGGVGAAVSLYDAGLLTGEHIALLGPAIFLMGTQLQHVGRCLGVIGVKGRMIPVTMAMPVLVAIASMLVMKAVLAAG